uniref:Uncharacterized protein n=1 Tax=Candidatus Kentrum sp. TUN TaxID=2126343 RepID=A0A450ZMC9_9GAMM|nr:MAG: hypothetical protein BECKTUN1418D_GA0071000_10253 [Candidatus Kentron sp. TUN]VFK55889.1 MAG: hypothetical protein BECKTUN1418F_GA0071002_107612 [Candidatus Kentron sp. TUN]VFK61923.1 MAG: hypothetical protein BECKTUN1418E_GA0071001_107312 [Candidatus Kentron sp. TUN]
MTENKPKTDPVQSSERMDELEKTCFVIMPFGKKDVGEKEVDFNAIYHDIFEPAIGEAKTPEGQPMIPARTDMDAFSGSINQEMFEYIMYSRMAFADISGFNPNVFYEIGARHGAQESGTVIFRQTDHDIPYDINSIKVFEYDHGSDKKAKKSREVITQVLSGDTQAQPPGQPGENRAAGAMGCQSSARKSGGSSTAANPSME